MHERGRDDVAANGRCCEDDGVAQSRSGHFPKLARQVVGDRICVKARTLRVGEMAKEARSFATTLD
jgi:hypothetical protein